MDIEKLLAANPAMTDIHLTEGLPLMIRVYGALKKMKEIAEPQLFSELISSYVPPDRQAAYQRTGSADSAFSLGNVRCRLHLYRSGGLASAAIRILPELSLLGADPDRTWLEKVSQLSHGLVLITGSSGSGKSTTMARILSLISQKRASHVVTLEDPVEYVIPMEKSLIHQREIGRDVADFPQGIRDALREDPDVIALGEMRDSETISAALTAAETGHLVLGTLHTTRAKDVPARIIHAFPGDRQEEIRGLLAANLVTVSSQMLYRSGKETWLLREILTNVAAVAHLIREGKEEQIPSYMEMGLSQMRTMKQAMYAMKGISERERERLLKSLE